MQSSVTYDLPEEFGIDHIHCYPLDHYVNAVGTYEFDFVTPAGNLDALSNNLKIKDLVYVSSAGKIKKVRKDLTNAFLKTAILGAVLIIKDDDKNRYSEKNFTEDGGVISVLHLRNIEVFSSKLFIHDANSTSADLRVAFNYAVDTAPGGMFEGLVKQANLDPETVIFN